MASEQAIIRAILTRAEIKTMREYETALKVLDQDQSPAGCMSPCVISTINTNDVDFLTYLVEEYESRL